MIFRPECSFTHGRTKVAHDTLTAWGPSLYTSLIQGLREEGRRRGGFEGTVHITSGETPSTLYTPAANVAGRSECPTLRGLSRFAPQVAEMLVELAVAGSGG